MQPGFQAGRIGDAVRVTYKHDPNYGCVLRIMGWSSNGYRVWAEGEAGKGLFGARNTMKYPQHNLFRPEHLEPVASLNPKSNYV